MSYVNYKRIISSKEESNRQTSPGPYSTTSDNRAKLYQLEMNQIIFIVAACLLVALASARPDTKYTDRYDNVDLKEIMSNARLRNPYVKCLLDAGKCSPDGKELKSHIREALANKCAKCTDKQKEGSRFVIGYLINHDTANWEKLAAKYDPQRKYVSEYESELREVKA